MSDANALAHFCQQQGYTHTLRALQHESGVAFNRVVIDPTTTTLAIPTTSNTGKQRHSNVPEVFWHLLCDFFQQREDGQEQHNAEGKNGTGGETASSVSTTRWLKTSPSFITAARALLERHYPHHSSDATATAEKMSSASSAVAEELVLLLRRHMSSAVGSGDDGDGGVEARDVLHDMIVTGAWGVALPLLDTLLLTTKTALLLYENIFFDLLKEDEQASAAQTLLLYSPVFAVMQRSEPTRYERLSQALKTAQQQHHQGGASSSLLERFSLASRVAKRRAAAGAEREAVVLERLSERARCAAVVMSEVSEVVWVWDAATSASSSATQTTTTTQSSKAGLTKRERERSSIHNASSPQAPNNNNKQISAQPTSAWLKPLLSFSDNKKNTAQPTKTNVTICRLVKLPTAEAAPNSQQQLLCVGTDTGSLLLWRIDHQDHHHQRNPTIVTLSIEGSSMRNKNVPLKCLSVVPNVSPLTPQSSASTSSSSFVSVWLFCGFFDGSVRVWQCDVPLLSPQQQQQVATITPKLLRKLAPDFLSATTASEGGGRSLGNEGCITCVEPTWQQTHSDNKNKTIEHPTHVLVATAGGVLAAVSLATGELSAVARRPNEERKEKDDAATAITSILQFKSRVFAQDDAQRGDDGENDDGKGAKRRRTGGGSSNVAAEEATFVVTGSFDGTITLYHLALGVASGSSSLCRLGSSLNVSSIVSQQGRSPQTNALQKENAPPRVAVTTLTHLPNIVSTSTKGTKKAAVANCCCFAAATDSQSVVILAFDVCGAVERRDSCEEEKAVSLLVPIHCVSIAESAAGLIHSANTNNNPALVSQHSTVTSLSACDLTDYAHASGVYLEHTCLLHLCSEAGTVYGVILNDTTLSSSSSTLGCGKPLNWELSLPTVTRLHEEQQQEANDDTNDIIRATGNNETPFAVGTQSEGSRGSNTTVLTLVASRFPTRTTEEGGGEKEEEEGDAHTSNTLRLDATRRSDVASRVGQGKCLDLSTPPPATADRVPCVAWSTSRVFVV